MITDLFSNVEDITLFAQLGGVFDRDRITSQSPVCCLNGVGGEVLINLRTTPGGIDYELGLGTSFLRGFASRVEGLDFRGSVRSLPSLSLYVSGMRLGGGVRGYAGGTLGFTELWNARAFDTAGTRHDVSAQTLELGASAGAYLEGGPLSGLFAEAAYRHRHFPSVDWGDDGGAVPRGWPRSLNLSGAVFSLGYQFSVKGDDDDEEDDPGLAGVWLGERLDGQEFPALLEGAGARQTELVGATLTLVRAAAGEGGEDGGDAAAGGSYELVLLRRVSLQGAGGATTTSPPTEPERGAWRVENGTVRLLRPGGGEAHAAVIDGERLHLRLAGSSHLLTLRRAKR